MKDIEAYSAKKTAKIMLNANELYLDVSKDIKKEILEAIYDIPFNRYPDETNQELIEAYSRCMNIDAKKILAGNGSDEMLGLLIGTFLGKGKTLYTLSPDFSMYDYYASMHEANLMKYPCREDGSFDIDDFIEKGREKEIAMILFSNPNNPSGHTLTNVELTKIVEAFPTIPVIIDEAYGEFAQETMLDIVDHYTNLFVTRTLSKAYGLAGARLGFLVGNKTAIAKLRPFGVPYNINSISQKIGTIVLSHYDEYQPIIEEIKVERDCLLQKLQSMKHVTFYPSQANYLYGRSEYKKELLQLLEDHEILIRTYANDTFRVTIGSKEENQMIFNLIKTFDKEVSTV